MTTTRETSGDEWPRLGWLAWVLAGATACGTIVGEPIGTGDAQQQAGSGAAGSAGTGGAGGAKPSGPPMMTPERAQQWCEWYVLTAYPGAAIDGAPPEFAPVQGHVSSYASLYCYAGPWPEGVACLMRPTVEQCVQNILHTWCEATEDQLTACVNDMITGNALDGTCPTTAACDTFEAAPGCDETVVLPMFLGGEGRGSLQGCSLRVE